MKYSGIYLVNNPSTSLETSLSYVNELVQGIETSLQPVTRQGLWSLSYRAFRDTIPPGQQSQNNADGKAKQFAHTYQHILNQTNISPNRAFIYIQPPSAQGNVVAIPRTQGDALVSLTRHQMAALWTPRHILSVQQGVAYESGIYNIQVGELRATREGPQSNAVNSPGVVVCIDTIVGEIISDESTFSDQPPQGTGATTNAENEIDFDYAQAVIRECWRKIKGEKDFGGRAEVKEAWMKTNYTTSKTQEQEDAVRLWCEVLRMRG